MRPVGGFPASGWFSLVGVMGSMLWGPFSSFTLLDGWQQRHLACKTLQLSYEGTLLRQERQAATDQLLFTQKMAVKMVCVRVLMPFFGSFNGENTTLKPLPLTLLQDTLRQSVRVSKQQQCLTSDSLLQLFISQHQHSLSFLCSLALL